MPDLRTVVVVDYQNIHLTADNLWAAEGDPRHLSLVHPLHFANQLLLARNARQKPGHSPAALDRVEVFRGLPSQRYDPKPYAYNRAQHAEWEADPRVTVTARPLKYHTKRTRWSSPPQDGDWEVISKQEKGIDVLCALAMVRHAADPLVDLVIIASHDTDLEPAIDAACDLGTAKVETMQWWGPAKMYTKQLRPSGRPVWNTRMSAEHFEKSRDRKDY